MKKNYLKILLDILLAITFVLLMNPRVFNGLPFHEIAGLVIGIAFLIHIGLNYRWVINTTKNIFNTKLPKKSRFNFLLNILLLISVASIIISGILISKVVFPSLVIQGGRSIHSIHSFFADATIALVGIHIGVHWQWVMIICKRAFKSGEGKLRKGVIALVFLLFAILVVGIQWFSLTASSNISDFRPRQIQQSGEGQPFIKGNHGNTINTFQGLPKGNSHGKGNHGGGSNPFLVILNYFGILAVIIIPTYYLEKLIFRKRKNKELFTYKLNNDI